MNLCVVKVSNLLSCTISTVKKSLTIYRNCFEDGFYPFIIVVLIKIYICSHIHIFKIYIYILIYNSVSLTLSIFLKPFIISSLLRDFKVNMLMFWHIISVPLCKHLVTLSDLLVFLWMYINGPTTNDFYLSVKLSDPFCRKSSFPRLR